MTGMYKKGTILGQEPNHGNFFQNIWLKPPLPFFVLQCSGALCLLAFLSKEYGIGRGVVHGSRAGPARRYITLDYGPVIFQPFSEFAIPN